MAEEIRVVKGVPTEEELAALVPALLSLPRGEALAPAPMSRWARSARPRGSPPGPGRDAPAAGPGAWRASALPR